MKKNLKNKALLNTITLGDCITGMEGIADSSIDTVFSDLPYNSTQCAFDKSIIDLQAMWKQLDRICKPNAAIILTADMQYACKLIMSNPKMFKYDWVWEKSKASQFMMAKKRPLKAHEHVLIFYRRQPIYNPQMTTSTPYDKGRKLRNYEGYGEQSAQHPKSLGARYPRSVKFLDDVMEKDSFIYAKTAESEPFGKVEHPTQKPVNMVQFFLRTYANVGSGSTVLDICAGSGSTAIAANRLGLNFIGFEVMRKYQKAANARLAQYGQWGIDIEKGS